MMAQGGERLRRWLDGYDHVASFGLYVRDRGVERVRHAADTPPTERKESVCHIVPRPQRRRAKA